jgi:hypothetical protein
LKLKLDENLPRSRRNIPAATRSAVIVRIAVPKHPRRQALLHALEEEGTILSSGILSSRARTLNTLATSISVVHRLAKTVERASIPRKST